MNPATLSASARRALRAAAHHLRPVATVGRAGLTTAVIAEIDRALRAHKLIKVRITDHDRTEREQFLAELCRQLGCEPVQHLGKLLVLWRDDVPIGTASEPKKSDRLLPPDRARPKRSGGLLETESRAAASASPKASRASRPATNTASRRREASAKSARTASASTGRTGANSPARTRPQPSQGRHRWGERRPQPPAEDTAADRRDGASRAHLSQALRTNPRARRPNQAAREGGAQLRPPASNQCPRPRDAAKPSTAQSGQRRRNRPRHRSG